MKSSNNTNAAPVNTNAAPVNTNAAPVVTFAIACHNLYKTGRKRPLNRATLENADVSRDSHLLKVYALYDAVAAISAAQCMDRATGTLSAPDKALTDAFFAAWRVLLNGLGNDERGKHYVASAHDLPFFLSLVRNLKADKPSRTVDKNDGTAPVQDAAPAPLKWGFNAPDAFRFNVEWLLGARVANIAIDGDGKPVTADKKRADVYKRVENAAKKADKKGATDVAKLYRDAIAADAAATGYDKRNKPADKPADK